MKRVVSNIQNLGFTIMNETTEGSKQKPAGIVIDQTLVNGQSQGVSVRLINGKTRSAAVKLDRSALNDLLTAVQEVLAIDAVEQN
jgi:phage major head subunit gpT-like protein|tara:strand:+ start:3527 stop:3781 length:255 start_codon:yes stop_codon:yes gene_type:complete